MSVRPGARLGPYEIVAKLGVGGMGEVWRATDARLRREVAIKVLPAAFTEDKERLARFEREAQLLAQLQHPNVASIYGLEESGTTRALVMELVEGPTLADRLADGPLPLEECLAIARQIATALEEAHEKGIVHRDLKPQNVKASPQATVKVLDFGLAKAMDPVVSPSGGPVTASPTLMNSPTLTSAGTQLGVILGTAAYMAPEQAAGGAVDRRADIWAFGVVLYEMLTGRRLFEGETVSHVLASVLKDTPDFSALPAETPPRIRRLLERCLRRKPRERLQSIGDARLVIDEVLAGARDEEHPAAAAAAVAGSRLARALPWGIAALAVGLALVVWTGPARHRAAAGLLRADLAAPEGQRYYFQGDWGAPLVLSSDGATLVFGARGESTGTVGRLWVRSLRTGEQREIAGTEGGYAPFLSPDGRSIGFFASGKLRTVELAGGKPLELADSPNGRGGAWAPDGSIVYSPDFRAPLYRIAATGGTPEELTRVDPTRHSSHRWPALVPEGDAVVYLAVHHSPELEKENELRFARLDGSDDHAVRPASSNALPVGDRLLYLRESTLLAQDFDSRKGAVDGRPATVVPGVLIDETTWRASFAANDRLLAVATGESGGSSRVSWVDREGRLYEDLTEPAANSDVRLSPDGRLIAVARGRPFADLWLLDVARGSASRFTFEPTSEFSPCWSPDGRWIYYATTGHPDSRDRIYRKPSSGLGAAELVFESSDDLDVVPTSVSPDGRSLLLMIGLSPFVQDSDLALLPLDGSDRLQNLTDTPQISEGWGRFGPAGRHIAYSSDEGGFGQVFVMTLGEGEDASRPVARWQVSLEGGLLPIWSGAGSELLFLDGNNNLVAVEVTRAPDGALRFGTPAALFSTTALADSNSLDVAVDGRILINRFGEEQSAPLRLIENWTMLLEPR